MVIERFKGCVAWDPHTKNQMGYRANFGVGIAFCVCFTVSMLLHILQAHRKRVWWCMVFAIGALTELIGWAGRTWSSECPYNLNAFLMQITTLIIAPTFFTAGIYIILGRLINIMGRHTSPISSATYLWIFCTCDFISLCVQAVGGAMASQAASKDPPSTSKLGTNIMVGGIVFQMASISVFVVLFLEFIRRVSKDHKTFSMRIKVLMGATAVSCFLIYVRSIYRTIELLQGWDGYLITHEAYFIGLDAVTMLLAVAVFNIIHPGWFLPDVTPLKAVDASLESIQAGAEK